jgi:hypothetical protein
VSRAFRPLGRSSRPANQCALEVQNAQSPSKISQGTSGTAATPVNLPVTLSRSPHVRKLG